MYPHCSSDGSTSLGLTRPRLPPFSRALLTWRRHAMSVHARTCWRSFGERVSREHAGSASARRAASLVVPGLMHEKDACQGCAAGYRGVVH
jgi:hypothetical protein